MFKNQQYIYIEVQFATFPTSPPEFSMILLEKDAQAPLLSLIDNSLREQADDDDYDGNPLDLKAMKLNKNV